MAFIGNFLPTSISHNGLIRSFPKELLMKTKKYPKIENFRSKGPPWGLIFKSKKIIFVVILGAVLETFKAFPDDFLVFHVIIRTNLSKKFDIEILEKWAGLEKRPFCCQKI